MNQDKLYQDFPVAVRCESADTVVFVVVPRGARYGDVRKTLGALTQRPYASIHIGPIPQLGSQLAPKKTAPGTEITPFNVDETVPEQNSGMLRAQILARNSEGTWVAE